MKLSKQVKTENWNGYEVRFIWHNDDWWAVATDIARALKYKHVPHMVRMLTREQKGVRIMDTPGGPQEMTVVSEIGIYAIIMRSRRKEAISFQEWVYNIIKTLRGAVGLESSQVLSMMDKEHQREAMNRLREGLSNPVKVDYIKANTIANKAVSSLHGYRKMVKKRNMSPDMLIRRQQILDDTVNLMMANESFGLGLSVSKTVYDKYLC